MAEMLSSLFSLMATEKEEETQDERCRGMSNPFLAICLPSVSVGFDVIQSRERPLMNFAVWCCTVWCNLVIPFRSVSESISLAAQFCQ